jgi:phosphoenolpyruvate synthase/pyruvate phosphate dikinase
MQIPDDLKKRLKRVKGKNNYTSSTAFVIELMEIGLNALDNGIDIDDLRLLSKGKLEIGQVSPTTVIQKNSNVVNAIEPLETKETKEVMEASKQGSDVGKKTSKKVYNL